MIFLKNSTELEADLFLVAAENIYLHSGILESGRGTKVEYIGSLEEAEKPGIYILRDDNLASGFIKSMSKCDEYFIPNENIPSGFQTDETSLFCEKDGIYLLKFDLIFMMLSLMFNKVRFDKREDFVSFGRYQRIPFMEHLLLKLKDDLKMLSVKNKSIFAETSYDAAPHFLPTFDFDRIHYYSSLKDIVYTALSALGAKGKAKTYMEARRAERKDPWERGEEIKNLLEKNKLKGAYFAFVSERDKFAVRYSLKDARAIKENSPENTAFGIHLSYESASEIGRARKEIEKGRKINDGKMYTRFHYLYHINERISEMMNEENVSADFSEGMRGRIGFSNGFCAPYRLKSQGTVEIPVSAMDSAMVLESKKECYSLLKIAEEVARVNGVFATIYHPSSMDRRTFPEYDGIIEAMIEAGRGMENKSMEDILEHYMTRPVFLYEDKIFSVDNNSKKNIKLYLNDNKILLKKGESITIKEE
ncbi:MAG: hypothetical protein AB7T10_01860 [bacterium]